MNILVTGGTGFIGSHTIVELANNGFHTVNIDNLSNSESFINDRVNELIGYNQIFYKEDVTDEKALQAIFTLHSIDAVIHFAAFKSVNESVEKPDEYYRNNVGATETLLRVMKNNGVFKLVFSSSCTVYGQPDILPVTEASPVKEASSPYGYTKQVCEEKIREFCDQNASFSAIILRYFNPVGAHPGGTIGELPRGVPNNLVPYISQTASGIRKVLSIFGNDYETHDGTCIRDFIHVVDLARAHVSALKKLLNTSSGVLTYNIGTGTGYTVLDVVHAFIKANQVDVPYSIAPRRKGDIEKIWADASLAQKELQWKSIFTLEEAMRHAWEWEKNYRSLLSHQ